MLKHFAHSGNGHGFEGMVVNALSQSLTVIVTTSKNKQQLQYREGERISNTTSKVAKKVQGTVLRFTPDSSILKVTKLSSAVFESYFRRLSFLHPTIRFSFTTDLGTNEYHAPGGIQEIFTAVTSPLQIMHDPIHIVTEGDGLKLEVVMAYHSWNDERLTCFINNGRAVSGGTHEIGLRSAIKRLRTVFELQKPFNNGMVAVASMYYADVTWEGCIKAKVSNPELRTLVSRFVFEGAQKWAQDHPESVEQIRQVRLFSFPDAW